MNIQQARQAQEDRIQDHRAKRRTHLTDGVDLLWESETTIDHEVAEMLWGVEDPEIRASIRARSEPMMPTETRLTAKLVIESGDPARLGYYAGLDQAIALVGGDVAVTGRIIGAGGTPAAAAPVARLAFDVPYGFERSSASISVDHANLRTELPLPMAVQEWPGRN